MCLFCWLSIGYGSSSEYPDYRQTPYYNPRSGLRASGKQDKNNQRKNTNGSNINKKNTNANSTLESQYVSAIEQLDAVSTESLCQCYTEILAH